MLTTKYINPLQHRVFNNGALVGYVTLHKGGWLFTAASNAMEAAYPSSKVEVKTWQAALPVAA